MTAMVMARPGEVSRFGVLTAVSVAVLARALFEGRMVEGQAAWVKPAKFALSFVVFFGTLALVEARLSPAWRESILLRVVAGVTAVAMIGEMAWMTLMAAQGQGSHFNFATPFHETMYSLMGLGAFLLVLGVAVVGVVVLRDGGAQLSAPMRVAVGWGFVLTFVLTLVTAFTMGSLGRHVGLHPADGAVIPLFGWSAVVGDLRPAHFLALHAMQVVPLAAWALQGRGGVGAVWAAGAIWTALTLAVFAQALAGVPLIALS
jgi:hypothetical protein